MKSTPLILAAGVIFGAIYGTNALLPDMYDNPTSEVQDGQARICLLYTSPSPRDS